jgi:hypothetical protein
MTCQSLYAPENTLTSVASQLLDSRARALLLRLLFDSVLGIFGVIENYISAWLACSHRASLRRSLDGGHFDAFGTSISSCALRHRASGTMEFAKLSDEASREASPPPRLVDLLHLVVARVAPQVVDKLHGFLVWKRGLSQSL